MQSLGGYSFFWNPERMTIPEKQKTVAVAETYEGNAIFEWPAIMQGTQVEMEWEFMPKGMYNALRALYLQTDTTFVWDPETSGNTYNVKIEKLSGEYFITGLDGHAYRRNIKMTLNIRSRAVITATTTTTTSTTTTA